jgi:hypothetical protein
MGTYHPTKQYERTDEFAPLVYYDDGTGAINPYTGVSGNFWFIKEGVSVVPVGNTPSDSSAYWQKADSLGIVITAGIFAEFAKLGKFIMTGDWMLSCNGTINGVAYNNGQSYYDKPAYMWFDPNYPDADHVTNDKHNFIPNYAVDGLTGKSYQNDAHIRGEVHVTSGTFTNVYIGGESVFTGFIRKNKIVITNTNYTNYIRSVGSGYTFDFDKCGNYVELRQTSGPNTLSLPLLSSAIGSSYTDEQKDEIRSYVGSVFMIYNKSVRPFNILCRYDSSGSTNVSLTSGTFACFECKLTSNAGDELIYWEYETGAIL